MYWAYGQHFDLHTSRPLKQAEKNKDVEQTVQISLALMFGEKMGLPFYYRKIAGKFSDVKKFQDPRWKWTCLAARKPNWS